MRFIRRLTLSQARLVAVDATFLLALVATALVGLGSTYTETEFWWVGMAGALLAVLTTVAVAVVLRLPTVVAALGTLGWFFLLGPVLCLRSSGASMAGPRSWGVLVDESLHGWKDLLTT